MRAHAEAVGDLLHVLADLRLRRVPARPVVAGRERERVEVRRARRRPRRGTCSRATRRRPSRRARRSRSPRSPPGAGGSPCRPRRSRAPTTADRDRGGSSRWMTPSRGRLPPAACASAELLELRFRAFDLSVCGIARSLGLRELALGPSDLTRGLPRLRLRLLDGLLRLRDALALRFLLLRVFSSRSSRPLCRPSAFATRLRAA